MPSVLCTDGRCKGRGTLPSSGTACHARSRRVFLHPPGYCGDNVFHEIGVSLTRIGGTPLRMDLTRCLGDFGDIPGSRVVLGFGVEL